MKVDFGFTLDSIIYRKVRVATVDSLKGNKWTLF